MPKKIEEQVDEKAVLSKDVKVLSNNTGKALAAAQELKIEDATAMEAAKDLLTKINQAGDMLKAKKDSAVKPIKEGLKVITEMFAPLEAQYEEAKKTVSSKMIVYYNEQKRKDDEEKARLAARVEKGTMKMATAVRKMEALPVVAKKIGDATGSVTFKEQKNVVITDANLIPRQFLVPDMVAIRKAALAGMVISGVAVETVTNLANHR
jgi:DNA repair exonuclease SbcCD ATPase subunit